MTEQELIELVNQKTPDEMSLEEIEQIREGISSSHMLREALADQLKVEQSLNESMGKMEVSVDKILLAAGVAGALLAPAPLAPVLLNWGVGSAIVAVLSSVLVLAVVAPPPPSTLPGKVEPPNTVKIEPEPPLDPNSIPGPSPGDPVLPPVDTSKNPNDPQGSEKTDPSKSDPAKDPNKKEAGKKSGKSTVVAAVDPSAAAKLLPTDAEKRAAKEKAAQDAWDQAKPDRPFQAMAFDDFTASSGTDFGAGSSGGKRPDQLLIDYFSPFPGHSGRISAQVDGSKTWGVFEGWLKFQPVWRKNGALRLSLFQENAVRFHFWNGREGVSLHYYQNMQTWAAYGATRTGGESQPATQALWDVDDDRYRRTALGTIEIRQQDGQLLVSRGDTLLLSVPFAGLPTEVYFEGRAQVRGIHFFHGQPFPAEPENPRPLVWRSAAPARMAASKEIPAGSELKLLDDGSVELSATKTQTQAWVAWPVPESGLTEIVFQVEGARPGAGVFVGDVRGKPVLQANFFRESTTKNMTVGWLGLGQRGLDSWHDIRERVTPWASSKTQWIRLVAGHGTAKMWTSGDGIHWGRALDPLRAPDLKGGYSLAGVFCQAGEEPRAIKLKRIEIRRFEALASLAPADLRAQAPALGMLSAPSEWLREVLASTPPGVPSAAWQRACAVKTLAGGATPTLARGLLIGLVNDAVTEKLPVATRIEMLEEASLLADTWEPVEAAKFARLYERLGQALAREGDPRPFTQVGQALIETSLWTQPFGELATMPDSVVRSEILASTYGARWADVTDVCRRIKYWNYARPHTGRPAGRDELLNLVSWASDWALLQWADKIKDRPVEDMPLSWRHPLVEQLSKEGFNILAEFEAALAGDSFQDACQIITSSSSLGALGLLPDGKDPQLLVSLPNAVALAMRESPGLKRTMQDQFGKVGMLRVKQAMAERNSLDVQAATVQFYGTDAAAEAHLWLGDRALASGDFPHAIGHYQHLLSNGQGLGGRQAQISARVRLAGALLGRDVGQAVTESVDLGGTTFAPADFEALVADLRTSRAVPGSGGATAVAGETSARGQGQAPGPARFETKQWTRFVGSQGAGGNPPRGIGDWAGQQISSLIVGDRMIVSNRLEVTAFDLAGGQQRWSRPVVGSAGRTSDWAGVAMTPVLAGDKLLVRWLAKNGPEVVALDVKNGNLLWTGRTGAGYVLCDPFVVQDQVHVLVATDLQNKILQVHFVTFDLRTGQTIAHRPVVQYRDVWNKQIPCQAVLVDDKIVATLGGSVICVNLLGHPQWLRRQATIPQSVDIARWFEQGQDPPVVSRGLVYASQPGVREVCCLDLETGRLRWQRAMPQLARVAGMVDGRLIVRTTEGLEALSAVDGKPLWQADLPNMLLAQLLPGTKADTAKADTAQGRREILVACSEAADDLQQRVRLSWLDPATGREVARRPLSELVHKVAQFGPLVAHEKRLWGFFRKAPDPAHEIFELTAEGDISRLSPSEALAELPQGWRRELPAQFREAAGDLFPGWKLIEGYEDRQAGYRKEWQGAKDVLAAAGSPGRGVTFARQVTIPAGSKSRLALKVGHDSADKWSIDVRVGTTTLASQRIEGETTSGGWKEWQVDLTPYAGKTVWLVVEQRGVEGAKVTSYWKQLEITN